MAKTLTTMKVTNRLVVIITAGKRVQQYGGSRWPTQYDDTHVLCALLDNRGRFALRIAPPPPALEWIRAVCEAYRFGKTSLDWIPGDAYLRRDEQRLALDAFDPE